MSLSAGIRLGPYEILSALGAGGMGEVYRARDTTLGRQVAIKILPEAFGADTDRLARFEREAKTLASLNHPNIAAIYGVEKSAGLYALVMELVEGEDLAQRIARGAIPPDEALPIAKQIADALEAAHEKGIIHRDLKPANIALSEHGRVKVLDFGLAKTVEGTSGAFDLTNSPTITSPAMMTGVGVILGTAAYMSPEQARGRTVDKRADIWAFGCVVYEMLAGRAAFARDTVTDTLAAIVEREPDWAALSSATPPGVRRLLGRCLEKDAKRRLRDIGEALFQLEESDYIKPVATAAKTRTRELLAWALAGVLVVTLGVTLSFTVNPRESPRAIRASRTVIALPSGDSLQSGDGDLPIAVSPDGNRLAYVAEHEGQTQLYVRELSELEAKVIPGTAGARHPFFSPDSRWLAFFANGALQKVAVAGGAPLRLCNIEARSRGGSWGVDGTIVFATLGSDLQRLGADGGTPQPLNGSGPAAWPEILPGGKSVLFTTGAAAQAAFAVASLDGGSKRVIARLANSPLEGPAVLGTGGALLQARYIANGYLVYGQSPGSVEAVPFDLTSLSVKGSPVSIVDSVERAMGGGGIYFGVSQTGLFVYASTGQRHQLVWVDRTGITTPISEDRAAFRNPRLSPDGAQIAVAVSDDTRRSDIWVYDALRGTKRRLTTDKHNLNPVWNPDGAHLTFSANGSIVEVPAGGGNAQVLVAGKNSYPNSWSPDGQGLLYQSNTANGYDVSSVTHAPGNVPRAVPVPLGQNPAFPQFSPDGRWVAYASDESGRGEVYVGRFPDLAEKIAVSADGGVRPQWSHNGRELFYRQGDALMAVSVTLGAKFSAGKPRRLFAGAYTGESREPAFDVSPDDQRFLMVKSDEAATLRQLTVVQNWVEELKRLVSTK